MDKFLISFSLLYLFKTFFNRLRREKLPGNCFYQHPGIQTPSNPKARLGQPKIIGIT
jgi:hypothetical protein